MNKEEILFFLEEIHFIYDEGAASGGYYEKLNPQTEMPIFDKIFIYDHRFDDEMIKYKNNYQNEYDFAFDGYYEGTPSGLFKYIAIDNPYSFEEYMIFSEEIYDNSFITERKSLYLQQH